VAECQVCGRRGALADFGFGAEAHAQQPPEVPLRLTVTVTYQSNGATTPELTELPAATALHAAEEGLLTGASSAEVRHWQADVAEIIGD
jgi:hypothetical protein